MRLGFWAVPLCFAASCATAQAPTPPAPTLEQIVAAAAPGDTVTVRGTVFAITFDARRPSGESLRTGDRYLLLRSKRPDGVVTVGGTPFNPDADSMIRAFGLGVRLPLPGNASLPRLDDQVEVTGVLRKVLFGSAKPPIEVPILEPTSLRVTLSTAPAPVALGQRCALDAECDDALSCGRKSGVCEALPATSWGDDARNVNGTCRTDDDCPAGQRCDRTYTVRSDGLFSPHYGLSRDAGRSLCVVDPPGLRDQCPRIADTRDLAGGRFAEGKEICVRARVHLPVQANDRDTHLQLEIDEALPYPESDAPFWLFGVSSEIAPTHKDPTRPGGALLDPALGARVVVLGTVRWDGGHGWYEVHPVKEWWPDPP